MTEKTKSLAMSLEADPAEQLDMAAASGAVAAVTLMNRAVDGARMTQVALARALGVTEGRVSQILNGDGNVRIATLARVLRAAGYRLRLSAEPADGAVPNLAWAPPRSRGPRYMALRDVTCVSESGVGPETVLQFSVSHPSQFGEPYQSVVDLRSGVVERRAGGPRHERARSTVWESKIETLTARTGVTEDLYGHAR